MIAFHLLLFKLT